MVNAETGEELENVVAVAWELDAATMYYSRAKVEVFDVELDALVTLNEGAMED